ncbi:MAG: type II toxin-antitoxin system PemK/MazF family toxin [Coxiellaceae bacterium]|nr:MAG: type II toxin-antitoxin system PemK/MazF family toxin [Coxiellaceae bacterium]
MNRGDIYWVDLNPTRGSEINKHRSCVIISVNPINSARHTVVVVPLSTSAKPRPPIALAVHCLDQIATAVCDQIRTVDKTRLGKLAGKLSVKDLNSLENSLRQVLGL